MEELKLALHAMSRRQRLEFFIIIGLTVLAVSAFCLIIYSTRKVAVTSDAIEVLQQQNEQLAKNNVMLISTVQDLNKTVQVRDVRDSILAIKIERTAGALPGINAKLDKIDKNYDSKISAVSSYSVPELEQYARAEADRLRREGVGK